MVDQVSFAASTAFDSNGDPLAGAKAYVYATGTTTPLTVYSDAAGTVTAANPVIADANGVFPQRFVTATAKIVVKTSADVTVYTLDPAMNSPPSAFGAANVVFSATANLPYTDVQSAIVGTDTNWRAQPAIAAATTGDLLYYNGTAWAKLGKGTAGQVLRQNDALTAPSWTDPLKFSASQATTSGTAFDFTGIPSWATRITVMLQDCSLSGTDNFLVQPGTGGGPVTSGYVSETSINPAGSSYNSTAGFTIAGVLAASSVHVILTMQKVPGGNTWLSAHSGGRAGTVATISGGGSIALGGTLTQVRLTRDGANTFDAGSVTVEWE